MLVKAGPTRCTRTPGTVAAPNRMDSPARLCLSTGVRTTVLVWNVGVQRAESERSVANCQACFPAFRIGNARPKVVKFTQETERISSWLGALNLGLLAGRQRESEHGTANVICVRPQLSSMGIDDGAAYRESNTHTARLGGVKGLEDPLAIISRDAWSGVAHRDEQVLGRACFGADHQFPDLIVNPDHGLDRVED